MGRDRGVTTRRNTSENHNKKRRNRNKKCRKQDSKLRNQDSKLRNQNGKLKTPLKPLTLQNRYARASCAHRNSRARGSTIFETFKAQNAEICTAPRSAPRRLDARGQMGVRISKLSGLKMPRSVLPCARAPPLLDKREARALARGSTSFETFRAQKCRNLSSPAPAPMPPSPEPRARARGSTILIVPQRPERARGSTNFEIFKAQKAEICTPPRPCPPVSWTPEARARARGSTIFETAQNAEICTPPRPWPPAPMDPMQVWKNFHIMSSTSTLEPQLALQATLEPHGPGIGQE